MLNLFKLRMRDGAGLPRLWNRLLDELQANTLVAVSPPLMLSRDTGGQRLTIIMPSQAASTAAGYDPFYLYDASTVSEGVLTAKVKVTGGVLMRGVQYDGLTIAASAELSVINGDQVWLERTAANTWGFNKGTSFPTDKLYFKLGSVAITGLTVTITRVWPGGNLTHDNMLRVSLTSDGGVAGGAGTTCSFTYTVKNEAGAITLLSTASPVFSMARILNVSATTAATLGTLHIDKDGNFALWDCNESQAVEYQESDYIPCEAPGS